MRGGGLVGRAAGAAEADVVDDEEGRSRVTAEALVVRIVGQTGMEVVEPHVELSAKDANATTASLTIDARSDRPRYETERAPSSSR